MENSQIALEQLISLVNANLTFSDSFPKILNDMEIRRIIKEEALEWFYLYYQFSTVKSYYYVSRDCMTSDVYTAYKYFILPEEIQNVVGVYMIDDPSLFRLGIQAPHLSINMGVTNQPFLTSFVTTIGELAMYRSVISQFSSEINKLNRQTLKFAFDIIGKRFQVLTDVPCNLMLETYMRIPNEELFDFQLFKDYVIGLATLRMGQALGRVNMNLPGNFQYSAGDIISQGQAKIDKIEEKIKGMTNCGFFIMGNK